jgi:hypothetical protein
MYYTDKKRDELVELATAIEKGFTGPHQYYKRFIAVNAFKYKKQLDIPKTKEFMMFMKDNTKIFSPFRANTFVLGSLLQLGYKKPERTFLRIRDHLDLLKANGFKKSQYLPIMSYTLDALLFDDKIQDMAIQTESYRVSVVKKAKEVYDQMKIKHPWITGGDDYPLALLIAHGGKSIDRVEAIYSGLHDKGLKKGNQLQSLSNILSLSNDEEYVLIDRVIELIERCHKNGFKVNSIMYPGIGLIALVENDQKNMSNVIEVTRELKKTKKFKWLEKNLLFMFAVTIVAEDIKQELSIKTIHETTLNITIEQIVMAQTAVMLAAITASTAGATTAT